MSWNKTKEELPTRDELVNTISPNGLEQKLRRHGNLWFVPDGSIYVYYTPTLWKSCEERGDNR